MTNTADLITWESFSYDRAMTWDKEEQVYKSIWKEQRLPNEGLVGDIHLSDCIWSKTVRVYYISVREY